MCSTSTETNEKFATTACDSASFSRHAFALFIACVTLLACGCQESALSKLGESRIFGRQTIDVTKAIPPEHSINRSQTNEERLAQLASDTPRSYASTDHGASTSSVKMEPEYIVRAQSMDDNSFSPTGFGFPVGSKSLFGYQKSMPVNSSSQEASSEGSQETSGVRTAYYQDGKQEKQTAGGSTDVRRDDSVQQAQWPELDTPDRRFPTGNGLGSINIGSPNEQNPLVQPFERGGNAAFPQNYTNLDVADLDVYIAETQTGRFNFGGAYNSDNGIVGQFTIDEKNFDITRWPRRFSDIIDGTAWRGGGQRFKLELVPGANLERYSVSLTEPYLFNTDYSLSVSAYLFGRNYFDWDEERLGGRVGVGRRLTQDISINMGIRMESVTISNPRSSDSPELNASLGTSNLYLFNAGLIRDTRDSQVNATEGTYLSLNFSQAFGDYNYSRGDLDFRTYRLMYERPDGSGRHTVSLGTKLGFSGSSTPIFENYFAGGFSTLRGFDFRGAGPNENGVRVGGEFQWLNTVEYMFPLTADDALKGVLFCDFGTVEESIEINRENFRVAPGFGFRVAMPGAAGGAPLAFDFAFPIATADGDEERVFSFYLGILR